MGQILRILFVTCCAATLFTARWCFAADSLLAESPWTQNGFAAVRFEINGTEGRNNPLRRSLREPFVGDELFVRYRLRYADATIDTPAEDEGEFIVLWLDAAQGNDASTHSGGVPNIGIHVSGGENRFMVRYSSGGEKFGPPLTGDRDLLIVGRLWKSQSGAEAPFDQFDLWVDPQPDQEFSPAASARSSRAIPQVSWIGFSTGVKTEFDDRITVWDIDLAETWADILDLPAEANTSATPHKLPPEPTIAFAADVLPILKSRCFECHAGDDPESDVRLDLWDEVLNQTSPRDADASRLIEVVAAAEMPPEGDPLTPAQIETLRTWINEGLVWDEDLLPTPIPVSDHWAFQPIRRPTIPAVAHTEWVRTPVDAFIARRHEDAGLTPAPEANRQTLRRRIALDLTGLPPGDQGRDHAPRDSAPPHPRSDRPDSPPTQTTDAHHAEHAGYVDQLLASRACGERWGRHWLDVARWAESNGHQHNRLRPHAWRYRDWVVEAFTTDMPFDEFLRKQIAGDELSPPAWDNLIATGFLAAARYSGNELDKQIQRNDILVDVTNTTANAFLGLTFECAQCHTHKFDPISLRDYYRLQAFFVQGQPGNIALADNEETTRALVDERWDIFHKVQDRLTLIKRKQGHPEPILIIPKTVVAGMTRDERSRYDKLTQQIAGLPQSWSFYSPATASRQWPVAPHEMRWPLPDDPEVLNNLQASLLVRGDVKSRGPDVTPAWPALFGSTPDDMSRPRTRLADWMTNPENPLTARVWINRIWLWHFGRGLVETAGDFGTQGTPPSHPQLLDYLASELIDHDWSTRHIHKLILDSATYRQSSTFHADNNAIDPDNRLLWRWQPRRLEAEAIRDSILAVAGELDVTPGGPSDEAPSRRRSLYLRQQRDNLPDQQLLFDSAGGNVSCSRRRVSTTALQPLWLLNSDLIQTSARALADRTDSIDEAFRQALGREPTSDDLADLTTLASEYGPASACLAILNTSEFLYIP